MSHRLAVYVKANQLCSGKLELDKSYLLGGLLSWHELLRSMGRHATYQSNIDCKCDYQVVLM